MAVLGSGITRDTLRPPAPVCVLCSGAVTDADYCRGCSSHVCEACDHPEPDKRPQRTAHKPEAHRRAV